MKRLFKFVGNQFEKLNKSSAGVNTDDAIIVSAVEPLETRVMLSAMFPAYVNGVFDLGDPNSAAPYGYSNTFLLESNPTATKTIYLDFDGHHSVNNSWGHNIMFPAFDRNGNPNSFSNSELEEIQKQFQNVAEDFLPFDVNVTTMDPGVEALRKTSGGDQNYGVRAVNTQATGGFGNGIGGVAFIGSFDDAIDNPVFTFNKGINNGGMTNSHEVGHSLGLFHDGLNGQEYHPGTGSGATGWGPIMGAPFGKNLTMWSDGNYTGATNFQDDLAVITSSANGFGFRADDHGNAPGTATFMGSGTLFTHGFIHDRFDTDFFEFDSGAGNIVIDIQPFGENPDLDVFATLYDSVGNVVATSNPVNDVDASFNESVSAGTYYLEIDGTGKSGVYDDYGSLGFFTINATIPDPPVGQDIGEAGWFTEANSSWKTINFSQSYVDPVVVVSVPSRKGAQPTTIRVRNVTSNSFQVRVYEWQYLDGVHGKENISWMVLERGSHTLADGTTVEAGTVNLNDGTWDTVNLGAGFSSAPVVMTAQVTNNGSNPTVQRVRNVSSSSFDVRMQEEEAQDQIHNQETISYIAWETGLGNVGGLYESLFTGDNVISANYTQPFTQSFAAAPLVFVNMQTFDGANPTGMRIKSISATDTVFRLEEEQSFDEETAHGTENVGVLAIEAGAINGASPLPGAPTPWVVTYIKDKDPFGEGEFWQLDCGCGLHDHAGAGADDGGCGCGLCTGMVSPADVAANLDGFSKLTISEQFALAHQLLNAPNHVSANATSPSLSNAGALELADHEISQHADLLGVDFEIRQSQDNSPTELKTLSRTGLSLISI